MRADYPLYIVALVCFIIAGYGYAYPFAEWTANMLLVLTLAILGVVFAVVGYILTPKEPRVTPTKPSAPSTYEPPPPPEISKREEPVPEPTPTPEPSPIERTEEMPLPEPSSETQPETAPEKKPSTRRRKKKTE